VIVGVTPIVEAGVLVGVGVTDTALVVGVIVGVGVGGRDTVIPTGDQPIVGI